MRDRRIWFFAIAAVVAFALTPVAPPQFQWVPRATAVAYVVLAILVALDAASRRRGRE